MLVTLKVVKGPAMGAIYQIVRPGVYVLGRSPKCHFVVRGDDFVSHAQFAVKASAVERTCELRRVQGSSNLCRVDGREVDAGLLRSGSVLEFGFSAVEIEMDWDAKVAFHHCSSCGAEVYLLPGETHTVRRVLCEKCWDARGHLQNPSPPAYACLHCGTDLSPAAGVDGRALELRGAVQYCCGGCEEKETRAGDNAYGSRVGPWRCLRSLGRGGMGEVLLVRHAENNRLAALKLLSNQATRERFVREMRLLKRFSHPNIVRYLDHVESAEDVYLVMQYVPGSNLDDHLLELGGPIEPARAVQVASECLSALAYLHRHPEGVFVHRDMKPENVLMASCAGAPSTPHITDFGLAKNVKGRTRLTRFGIMMGSCGFSPWEQMRDASSAGAPADTYALGMILYYMLTGLFPYDYPSPLEVLERARLEGLALSGRASFQRIQNELTRERGLGTDFFEATLQCCLNDRYQPTPLRERSRSEIPPAVAAVVDRAVSKRIESRYADAVEMLEALHAAVLVAGWRANGG